MMQSPAMTWGGRIISALVVLFFLFDSITKVMMIPEVVQPTVEFGFQESHVLIIGMVLLLCTIVYVIPPTAVLGAILLTAYLGGAVVTHLRAESGAFPIIFSVLFGVLVWLGLYLRNSKLRELVPWQ